MIVPYMRTGTKAFAKKTSFLSTDMLDRELHGFDGGETLMELLILCMGGQNWEKRGWKRFFG